MIKAKIALNTKNKAIIFKMRKIEQTDITNKKQQTTNNIKSNNKTQSNKKQHKSTNT